MYSQCAVSVIRKNPNRYELPDPSKPVMTTNGQLALRYTPLTARWALLSPVLLSRGEKMEIVVIGGTGLIGSKAIVLLRGPVMRRWLPHGRQHRDWGGLEAAWRQRKRERDEARKNPRGIRRRRSRPGADDTRQRVKKAVVRRRAVHGTRRCHQVQMRKLSQALVQRELLRDPFGDGQE